VLATGSSLSFDGTTLGVNNGVTGGTALSLTGTYAGSGTVAFLNFQRTGGAVAGTLGYDDANTAMRFGTTTNHSTIFLQNNTEAMRLTSSYLYTASGIKVAIGDSSASAKLTVAATSADPSLATISNGGITIKGSSGVYLTSGTASTSPFGGWIQASDGGSQAYAMSLNPLGGNVGIGTSLPTKKLDVNGDALINGLTVGRGGGNVSTNTAIGYQAGIANTTGSLNTFIGVESGLNNLIGVGNTFVGRTSGLLTTGSYNCFVGQSTAAGEASGFYMTTGTKNTILGGFNGNQDSLNITTSSNYVVIADGDGARQITMKEGQTLALDSAVPNAGTGITFPASQSASSDPQTLDDYEEGDWTASFVPNTSGTITLTNQVGTYTKVGRAVTLTGLFSVASVSSPTGYLRITGIPFAGGSNPKFRCAASINGSGMNATMTTVLVASIQGDSNIYVFKTDSVGGLALTAAADIKAGTEIFINVTYIID
jgi:hypothetical protein